MLLLIADVGCGGDEEKRSACDLQASPSSCEGEQVCVEQEDGSGLCQIRAGGACDPDADEPNCRRGAHCAARPSTLADTEPAHLCLMERAESCDPSVAYCDEGLTCAPMEDDSYQCHYPVFVEGTVARTDNEEPIAAAHLIVLDAEGVAVTDVALTGDDGSYQLEVPVRRDAEGVPLDERFTLRAAAQLYQPFPGGLRRALPFSASDAREEEDHWVVSGALSEIQLIALPETEDLWKIQGSLELHTSEDDADSEVDAEALAQLSGVLIVAEGPATLSAITDRSGHFTLFNAPAGSYSLSGYAASVSVSAESTSVGDQDVADVTLQADVRELADVSGSVQIVNAPGGAATSVILVLESTFDEALVRGETPRGLRAPRSGAPNVEGAFTIENVPAGRYVVLAAFENDDLVRDPDSNIAGTDIVRIEVADGDLAMEESFKVTEALAIVSPGATQAEAVTAAPTLSWADDSSEDGYSLQVYNALGELVWEEPALPSQSGGDNVSVEYGGPLSVGMYYQFRVTSFRQPSGKDASSISATEDLTGVFYYAP